MIPSLRRGGAEKQFLMLSSSLHKRGYDISFITYKKSLNSYDTGQIRCYYINKKNKVDIIFLFELISHIRSKKIDVLLSCYQGIFEGPMLWARLVKIALPSLILVSSIRSSHFGKASIIIELLLNQFGYWY